MKADRRRILRLGGAVAALGPLVSASVFAQRFPSRPVSLIIPFAPGGDTDIRARLLQPHLQKHLGQPVVMVNRPGAGGVIGYDMIAKAAPDGYTVGAINFPSAYSPILEGTAKYKAEDFEPLIMQSSTTIVVATAGDSPYKTLKDLVDAGRRNKGAVAFAIPGYGHPAHLAQMQFVRAAGAEFNTVAFNGGAKVMEAILSNTAAAGVLNNTEAAPLAASGKMRVLAVFGDAPDPLLPGAPTAASAGYPITYYSAGGFAAPRGIPRDVLATLVRAFEAAAQDPEYIKAAGDKIPLKYMAQAPYDRFLTDNYRELADLWKRNPWSQK
ncbi:MAG TPA: tripartite tricarboxylate transporter substrate binding protein [Ramlibacter sp.]|jgi:tripartite-type tricarboxylate transporter receptor subunit TctC|nr:tripartite tricarboxylate transporter substrate binding protein [Ramlibacter sp.]